MFHQIVGCTLDPLRAVNLVFLQDIVSLGLNDYGVYGGRCTFKEVIAVGTTCAVVAVEERLVLKLPPI